MEPMKWYERLGEKLGMYYWSQENYRMTWHWPRLKAGKDGQQ